MIKNLINSLPAVFFHVTGIQRGSLKDQLAEFAKQIGVAFYQGPSLYWSFVRKGHSAYQCIDELCFQRNGPLVKEFERLFESLFEAAKPYIELIRTIAKYRYGIGQAELIAKSKLPDGGTTVSRLHQLEEAGFITSLIPYGRKDKGLYYVIDDEYSLFYLYWMEQKLKVISRKSINQGFWLAQANQPAWKTWAALSFESTCYKHIDQIRKALKIDPGASSEPVREANTEVFCLFPTKLAFWRKPIMVL